MYFILDIIFLRLLLEVGNALLYVYGEPFQNVPQQRVTLPRVPSRVSNPRTGGRATLSHALRGKFSRVVGKEIMPEV